MWNRSADTGCGRTRRRPSSERHAFLRSSALLCFFMELPFFIIFYEHTMKREGGDRRRARASSRPHKESPWRRRSSCATKRGNHLLWEAKSLRKGSPLFQGKKDIQDRHSSRASQHQWVCAHEYEALLSRTTYKGDTALQHNQGRSPSSIASRTRFPRVFGRGHHQ